MASKKYSFFIGILCLFASGAFAQVGTSYNVLDSSFIPTKSLPQHNEFINNAYPFPAKPRNQWELGVKAGAFQIFGDIPSRVSLGFGAHIRKALGYTFSLRLEYLYGTAKGVQWKPRTAGFSNPWLAAGYTGSIYDNYRAKVQDLTLQGIANLNNIQFHKAKVGMTVYALAGIGGTIYSTKVDVKNAAGANYSFAGIQGGNRDTRGDTRDQLENLFDGNYETDAENDGAARAQFLGRTIVPSVNFGGGIAFRLGKRINLAIEDRVALTPTDLLDGQRWQNASTNAVRVLSGAKDIYNYLTVGLNFNLGGAKSVEPLWWLNPLDYAYNELNAPKHMKLPKPVLDDADGDGVTDQFDNEPNTPANTPVDVHGVTRDTDGDGVPDARDKELITPTQCQPVNADGVGTCPPPACCATLDSLMKTGSFRGGCGIGDLPSVSFSGRSVTLSNDARAVLASVAEKIRNNPNCRIEVVGYGETSKSAQQLSWDRVNAVINHLVEREGISSDRLIFKYGESNGDANTVDLREGTQDGGPNTVPAPHPNLRRRG
jgi:outer membrane protein OmpA-like peptidoglycan-associated protein